SGTIELGQDGAQAPDVYGADGSYQRASPAGNGRFRAIATANTALFGAIEGKLRTPTLVRAVAGDELRASDPGYDYLIVAHPQLIDAIQPLAAFHRTRGLRVAVADVDAVYDEFNGGIA